VDVRWISPQGVKDHPVEDLEFLFGRDGGFVWVDVPQPDPACLATLGQVFDFHSLALGECTERIPVPRMHVYADHAFVVVNGLCRGDDDQIHLLPLKHFVGPSLLVTVHGPFHSAVDPEAGQDETRSVLQRLEAGRLRPLSGVELGHAIVTALVRRLEDVVNVDAGQIAGMERRVMRAELHRSEAILEEMFTVRHDLQTVRTTAAQSRQIYIRMARMRAVPADVRHFAEDLAEQFDGLREVCDDEKDYLQEVLDLYQARVANELNRFVRQLTSWGAIGIAGTWIAGIYGMNFAHMPELNWTYGYAMALGMMAVVGVLFAWFFRRRGWL
jgi:magnesium/cobalt transport protein CorA